MQVTWAAPSSPVQGGAASTTRTTISTYQYKPTGRCSDGEARIPSIWCLSRLACTKAPGARLDHQRPAQATNTQQTRALCQAGKRGPANTNRDDERATRKQTKPKFGNAENGQLVDLPLSKAQARESACATAVAIAAGAQQDTNRNPSTHSSFRLQLPLR